MEDKQDLTIEKYGFQVKSRYRARGALILDTSEGLFLMREYEKISGHFELENAIKQRLFERGMELTDRVFPNRDGELVTQWDTGEKYVVYHWYSGEACDCQKVSDLEMAAKNLGCLHRNLKNFGRESGAERGEIMQPGLSDCDGRGAVCEARLPGKDSESGGETLAERYERYNRELKRVYQFMKQKKRKSEFEFQALACYHDFYQKAEEASRCLLTCEYAAEFQNGSMDICHGAYNYHNLIFTPQGTATTNFESASYGIQLLDLAYFLRKVQEKNGWQMERGKKILGSYASEMPLGAGEREFLFYVLSYPMKYRKLMNQYMNGKKSWISDKNMEKLRAVRKMESAKDNFLKNMSTI